MFQVSLSPVLPPLAPMLISAIDCQQNFSSPGLAYQEALGALKARVVLSMRVSKTWSYLPLFLFVCALKLDSFEGLSHDKQY